MALFTDFNTSFAVHPTKKDLSLQTDVDAVKQSIKNLVLTDKMERLFQPTLGCDVRKMLFENITPQTLLMIKTAIGETINRYEPRAEVQNVTVSPDEDHNAVYISVMFSIINNRELQEVNLILERVR